MSVWKKYPRAFTVRAVDASVMDVLWLWLWPQSPHSPAEVVGGGGGADPIVVDAGPGVSVARGAGGESPAPNRVRFGPVLRG